MHVRLIKLFIYIFFISVLFVHGCTTKQTKERMKLESLNSMSRIRPSQVIQGETKVEIKAAKNEYEAFQVVIFAPDNARLKNVKVEITDLVGEKGKLDRNNITLFKEEYIYVRHSTPRATCNPGVFPDPLLPFVDPGTGENIQSLKMVYANGTAELVGARFSAKPMNIAPGQNGVIWVDVYVPKEIEAGKYVGTFKAKADEGFSAEIPITLTVWDFLLPDVASYRTHFGHFSNIASAWEIDKNSDKFEQIEERFCKSLAKHRINPPIPKHLLPLVNDDGSLEIIPSRDKALKKYIEETHLVDFEIPRAKFIKNSSNNFAPIPKSQTDPVAIEKTKRYYREYYSYVKKNGWEKRTYVYMLDEPNSLKDYQQVINLGKIIKEAVPELKRVVVEQPYKHEESWPDLDGSLDIWCPLMGYIDRESVQEKIKNGDEVWTYSALVQKAPKYHPHYDRVKGKDPLYWHLDQPASVYRRAFWLSRQYDITGFIYWTSVNWASYTDAWLEPFFIHQAQTGDDPTLFQTHYYNGGGILFYPGKDAGFDGPVTSIRLKNVREGLEDYEYFAILDRAGQGQFVKDIVNEICPEWWTCKGSPERLLKVREKLAEKIIILMSQK